MRNTQKKSVVPANKQPNIELQQKYLELNRKYLELQKEHNSLYLKYQESSNLASKTAILFGDLSKEMDMYKYYFYTEIHNIDFLERSITVFLN